MQKATDRRELGGEGVFCRFAVIGGRGGGFWGGGGGWGGEGGGGAVLLSERRCTWCSNSPDVGGSSSGKKNREGLLGVAYLAWGAKRKTDKP